MKRRKEKKKEKVTDVGGLGEFVGQRLYQSFWNSLRTKKPLKSQLIKKINKKINLCSVLPLLDVFRHDFQICLEALWKIRGKNVKRRCFHQETGAMRRKISIQRFEVTCCLVEDRRSGASSAFWYYRSSLSWSVSLVSMFHLRLFFFLAKISTD